MIKLDKNYSVEINSIHGFNLEYKSDPQERDKEGEIEIYFTTDTWYYPKLSQILNKYYLLNLTSDTEKELLETVLRLENKIEDFSKIFAKKGLIFKTN